MILSPERFKSLYTDLWNRYVLLLDKFPDDKKWKKMRRLLKLMKSSYGRDKVYAVKYLHNLERIQPGLTEERRAFIVRAIELMKKVILQKKVES
jgi:hypothetical protein